MHVKAVTVESIYPGKLRHINSVAEAAEFLLNECPGKTGKGSRFAQQACLEAMEGGAGVDEGAATVVFLATPASSYITGPIIDANGSLEERQRP